MLFVMGLSFLLGLFDGLCLGELCLLGRFGMTQQHDHDKTDDGTSYDNTDQLAELLIRHATYVHHDDDNAEEHGCRREVLQSDEEADGQCQPEK